MSTQSTWERIIDGERRHRGESPNQWEAHRGLVQAIADEIDAVRELATTRLQEVVKLADQALDLVEPAFDAGLNGEHGIEQSEAREAIRTQLEALEKNA